MDKTVREEIKCLLRKPEFLDPLMEKSYRAVKMKNPSLGTEDFKLYLKHFAEQCKVPAVPEARLNEFLGKLKDKKSVSKEEFITFIKGYLTSLIT